MCGDPAMAKYSVASLVLGVYLAGSAWIVGRTGESYRANLRRERATIRTVAVVPHKAEPETAKAKDLPPPSVGSTIRHQPTESTQPIPPTEPQPPTITAETESAPKPPATPPPVQPPVAADPAARVPKVDPLWTTPEVSKVWDVEKMGLDDERQFGRELHELITRLHKPLPEGALTDRLYDVAEPLTKDLSRKDLSYKFTVLDADGVNAFSHTGRYVYVTRGLLAMIGEDEDYALQFVVAHEIAHVEFQHMRKCLSDPGVKKIEAGTLAKAYLVILPWGYYPETLDFEADRWAGERLKALARTRRESLSFLLKLQGYAKKNHFERERKQPERDADSSILENHIKAHPRVRERLEKLEALWKPAVLSPR
jgi:hypothetical protein